MVGIIITLTFIFFAFSAPLLENIGIIQDPLESLSNPINQPPNSKYWFGTTGQGYDVFPELFLAHKRL